MDCGTFNTGTAVHAGNCTQGCADTVRESALTLSESWLGEKNPLLHWGIKLPQQLANGTLSKFDCGRKIPCYTGESDCLSSSPIQHSPSELHPKPWLLGTEKLWIHGFFLSFFFRLHFVCFVCITLFLVFHFFYSAGLVRFTTNSGTDWKAASQGPSKSMCWHKLSWHTLVTSFHLIWLMLVDHVTMLSEVWHVADFSALKRLIHQLVHVMFIQASPSGRPLQLGQCLYRCVRSSLCGVGVSLCEIITVCGRCIAVWDLCVC